MNRNSSLQERTVKEATHAAPAHPTSMQIRMLIATIVPQFAFGLSFAWIGLAPYALQQSHWSPTVIEAIYALTPLSASFTFLFSARLVSLIPLRRLCWLGIGLFLFGLAVAFLFPNEFTFIVFYAMLALGVGYGITLAAALAAMAQLFPRHIGTMGGALSASYGLAAVVEVPVIATLTTSFFWIDAVRIVGVSIALLAVAALALMPTFPPVREQSTGSILPVRLFTHPRILTAALLIIVAVPLGSYALSQVGIYAQDLRLAAVVSTTAVIVAAIASTSGRFVSGLLSDHMNVNVVILLIVFVDAIGGLTLWRTSAVTILLIAAGAVGFACGGLGGTIPRLATDASRTTFNTIADLLYAAYALGSFVGPLIGSTFGGKSLAWLVLGSISTISVIIALWRITALQCSEAGKLKRGRKDS